MTAAVFALILAAEVLVLVPSLQRFDASEREQLAERARAGIETLIVRGAAEGRAPALEDAVGRLQILGVALTDARGVEVARAGVAPGAAAQGAARFSWPSPYPEGARLEAVLDVSGLAAERRAYIARIAGLVAVIVLVVTIGTLAVLDRWVLRPLLRLRESSMRAGADPDRAADYALAPGGGDEVGELIAAHNDMLVQVAQSRARDRAMAEERARFLTRHDALTGLPNRAALAEHLQRCGAAGATVFLVNLLRFRVLNATHGAAAGDRLLREVARRLRRAAQPGDFVACLGGDRFAVAHGAACTAAGAAAIAERLLYAAEAPLALAPDFNAAPALRLGIAVGAACGADLLAQAELALGRTYEPGAGKYAFYSAALAEEARERQTLTRELEVALERRELFVAMQPKVHLSGAPKLAGAEVLLRWRHPVRGMVSPAQFIPLAEATGLIQPIGDFVLNAACAQLREWRRRHGSAPRLAVNIAAPQFQQDDLVERTRSALEAAQVPAGLLELEITESSAMGDIGRSIVVLDGLRSLGVKVSIDDFGTGYSSLAYLRRFAVDALKIDKSFVDDIGVDRNAEAVCDAILRLGQAIGTRVVAEGVEREEQVAFLRRRRCDEAQGWFFGKPLQAAAFERAWLATGTAVPSGQAVRA